MHYTIVGQAIYGDGRYYWANAHSIFFDHNLILDNELKHQWNPINNNLVHPIENRIAEPYLGHPLGTSLFWLPGIAVADFFFHGNGYGDPYQIATGLSAIAFVAVGFYLLAKKVSLPAVLFLFLTTNLFYYSSVDVLNSHPISFFLSSLFLYLYLRNNSWTVRQWLFIGILTGVLVSVREQDLLTVLPFLLERLLKNKRMVVVLIFGALVGYLSQLYFRLSSAGTPLSPWLTGNNWYFNSPKLGQLFTSNKIGILIYSPSIILALWGLFIGKQKWYRLALAAFVLQLALISVWWAWDQGEAYGVRMLISTYPMLVFGFDEAVKRLSKVISFKTIYKIIFTMMIVNFSLIFKFLLGSTGINGSGIDPTTWSRIEPWIKRLTR